MMLIWRHMQQQPRGRPPKKHVADGAKCVSVYFYKELHDKVVERARSLRSNVSEHLRRLAIADLKKGGPLVIEPEDPDKLPF